MTAHSGLEFYGNSTAKRKQKIVGWWRRYRFFFRWLYFYHLCASTYRVFSQLLAFQTPLWPDGNFTLPRGENWQRDIQRAPSSHRGLSRPWPGWSVSLGPHSPVVAWRTDSECLRSHGYYHSHSGTSVQALSDPFFYYQISLLFLQEFWRIWYLPGRGVQPQSPCSSINTHQKSSWTDGQTDDCYTESLDETPDEKK